MAIVHDVLNNFELQASRIGQNAVQLETEKGGRELRKWRCTCTAATARELRA
jgi:hypothetical protein